MHMGYFSFFLAYLDPGSGSLLIQALLAGLFGVLVSIKLWTGKVGGWIRHFFRGRQNSDELR